MVPQSTVNLAVELGAWLEQRGWRCVTAESCTAGGIGYAISTVAGSSAWYEGGFITYSNAMKQSQLGVTSYTLAKYGAVSAETAAAMARGALTASGAEMAVAVTGVAGPGGGSAEKPVGLVWFGLAWQGECITWQQVFPGDRQAVRLATINEALLSIKKIT